MSEPPRLLPLLLLPILLAALAGCDEAPRPPAGLPGDQVEVRIVSLAPALTQMLLDLGKKNLLVGVGNDDFAAPKGLPVVGTTDNLNAEALLALRPTLVLLMTFKEGVPARLRELASRQGFAIAAYPSPLSVDDVLRIISDEMELTDKPPVGAQRSLGTVLDIPADAARLKLRVLRALTALRQATARAPRPRTLMVIGTNPIQASGPKTTHDELLALAGGANAVADAKVGAPELSREALIAAAPEVILYLLPGAPPLAPLGKEPRLADLANLPIPAVLQQRVVLINHPLALLPSSSIADLAAQMAKAVHPELATEIDAALKQVRQAATAPAASRPAAASATATRPSATTTAPATHAGR